MLNFPNRTGWGAFTGVWPHPMGIHKKMGGAVQVGPPAGWEPLLSSALQELSVARHLSCSVAGLARFSLPQSPSGQGLRLASSGHTRVTWAEHRHSAIHPWSPMEPTHSAPPLSPQEAGISEWCPPGPDTCAPLGKGVSPPPRRTQACPGSFWTAADDVPKWLRGSPAKRVCSACAGSNPAVCVFPTVGAVGV